MYEKQNITRSINSPTNVSIKIVLSFIFLISAYSINYGQVKAIDLDINSRSISEDIPFDQYFTFKSFKTDYDVIEFKLTIDKDFKSNCSKNERDRKKYYFCGMSQFDTLYIDPVDKVASFRSLIGPIHPNVPYNFEFRRVKYVKFINSEEEKKFKNDILEVIKESLKVDYTSNELKFDKKNLDSKIFELVKKYSKVNNTVKLLDKNGNQYTKEALFEYEKLGATINGFDNLYETLVSNLDVVSINQELINQANRQGLYKKIGSFASSKSKTVKQLLNTSISNIDSKTDKTLKELIQLLFQDLNNFENVINGKLKIYGGKLVKLDQIEEHKTKIPDKNSLVVIKTILKKVKPILTNDTQLIDKILNNLENIEESTKLIGKKHKEIKSSISYIPNILEGAFLKDEFKLSHTVSIPVEASKDIYYGLDVGFMYAFDINTVFTYQGLNIYLAPINRETPLSMYKGRDRWLKRLSIYVGIAQTLSSAPDNYDSLFGGNSLLFGAGWRFNRAMRINVGGLVYKERNANPLISETEVTVRPTISLTVDLDLAAGLGAIGKAFNFIE